jgi:hypothetical protein
MQFIAVDSANEDNLYRVTAEAAEFLTSLGDAPIAVTTICGLARRGKSTLLNMVLEEKENAFATSSTTNAQTMGLWLARKQLTNPDTGDRVLLCDSEGLGSCDANAQHDSNIFVLTMLVSSHVYYNHVGALTSSALNELEVASRVADILREDSNNGGDSASTPGMTFLLRDFSLEMKDKEGNVLSPTQYVDFALSESEYGDAIKELFPHRTAFTLPRPASTPYDLKMMTNLTPNFLNAVDHVRHAMVRHRAKTMPSGGTMSGVVLLTMARAYCEALNEHRAPRITSMWTAVAEAETRSLVLRVLKNVDADIDRADVGVDATVLTSTVVLNAVKLLMNGIVKGVDIKVVHAAMWEVVEKACAMIVATQRRRSELARSAKELLFKRVLLEQEDSADKNNIYDDADDAVLVMLDETTRNFVDATRRMMRSLHAKAGLSDDLQEQVRNFETKAKSHVDKVRQMELHIADLENSATVNNARTKQTSMDYDEEIETLRKELGVARTAIKDLTTRHLDTLQQARQSEESLNNLQEDVHASETLCATLSDQVRTMRSTNQKLTRSLEDNEGQLEEVSNLRKALDRVQSEASEAKSDAKKQQHSLKLEVASLKTACAVVEASSSNTLSRKRRRTSDSNGDEDEERPSMSSHIKIKTKLEWLERRAEELVANLKETKSELRSAQRRERQLEVQLLCGGPTLMIGQQ